MKETDKLFFELIRVAIGTADSLSRLPSQKEWKAFYDMAKKQSLVGVCFAALRKLGAGADEGFARIGISEMLYMTWLGMTVQIQKKNETVNQQCAELQAKLSADGYRNYIMKGQGNSALYTSKGSAQVGDLALLRQSGDIDVYLEGGLDKVLAYANTFAPTNEVNELEMHVKIYEDTEVEFHYRPFIMRNPFKNCKLQRFFAEEGETCFENKIVLPNGAREIGVPTTTFNLVHQMVHIYHHLLIGGIGMRQVMDYYFVVKHEMEVLKGCDVQKVREVVASLGLKGFASALMWVLGEVFSLERSSMLWEPNEENGRFLLNEVVLSGNFGNYDERLPQHRNKWQSFWMLSVHNLRLFRFTYDDWFWGPLWRLYQYMWRKSKGFK